MPFYRVFVVRVTAHPQRLGTLRMKFEPKKQKNTLDKGKSGRRSALKGNFRVVYITEWWGKYANMDNFKKTQRVSVFNKEDGGGFFFYFY